MQTYNLTLQFVAADDEEAVRLARGWGATIQAQFGTVPSSLSRALSLVDEEAELRGYAELAKDDDRLIG